MYTPATACLNKDSLPIYFGNFVIAILIALAATAAIAQTTGGATLVGAITDKSGAVVPGAKVTVINIETLFRSETQTSPEGTYYVPYLNPGRYTMEATLPRRTRPGHHRRAVLAIVPRAEGPRGNQESDQ